MPLYHLAKWLKGLVFQYFPYTRRLLRFLFPKNDRILTRAPRRFFLFVDFIIATFTRTQTHTHSETCLGCWRTLTHTAQAHAYEKSEAKCEINQRDNLWLRFVWMCCVYAARRASPTLFRLTLPLRAVDAWKRMPFEKSNEQKMPNECANNKRKIQNIIWI